MTDIKNGRGSLIDELKTFGDRLTMSSIMSYADDVKRIPQLEYKNNKILAAAIVYYHTKERVIVAPLDSQLLTELIQRVKSDKKWTVKQSEMTDIKIASNILSYIQLLIDLYISIN